MSIVDLTELYVQAEAERVELKKLIHISVKNAREGISDITMSGKCSQALDVWQNAIGRYYYAKAKAEMSKKKLRK